MKAVVAAFNQEKALVGAFSVLTNLRMELFQALNITHCSAGRRCAHLPVIRGDLSAAHYLAACKCPQHSGVTCPQPQHLAFANNWQPCVDERYTKYFSNPEYHKLCLNIFLPRGKAKRYQLTTVFLV